MSGCLAVAHGRRQSGLTERSRRQDTETAGLCAGSPVVMWFVVNWSFACWTSKKTAARKSILRVKWLGGCYGPWCNRCSDLVRDPVSPGDDFCSAVLEQRSVVMFMFTLLRLSISHGTWTWKRRAPSEITRLFIISAVSRSARAPPFRTALICVRGRTITQDRIFYCCVRRSPLARRLGFVRMRSLGRELPLVKERLSPLAQS